jgi:predicted chitinase
MGMGQVQGENYEMFGFKSAKEMNQNFSQSEENQIRGAVNYIKAAGLVNACKNSDFASVASGYNGEGQVKKYSNMLSNGVEQYKNMKK